MKDKKNKIPKFGEWSPDVIERSKIWETMQKEHAVWADHNFPGSASWEPLIGLGEELGELAGAETSDDIKDAIGDCGIYMVHYCNLMYFDLKILNEDLKVGIPVPETAMIAYGKICHGHLKLIQQIRMNEGHRELIQLGLQEILSYLKGFHSSLDVLIWNVWVKVRQRDWKRDPNTAHFERPANGEL